MRVTLNKINAAIKAAGGKEELAKGEGYYYFMDGDAAAWPFETGVYGPYRLGDISVEQWVEEWRFRHDKYEEMKKMFHTPTKAK
jgi:hypothetical protein